MTEQPTMRRLKDLDTALPVKIDEATLLANPKQGLEKQVNRVELYYPEHGQKVDGLVLLTPHDGDGLLSGSYVEKYVRDTLEQWRRLKEINQRRAIDKQPTMTLPPTVRQYRDEDFTGILMTDLSENETRPVLDVRELAKGDIIRIEWEQIRSQIERDLRIAEEEGLLLGGGPSHLDSWSVVYDFKQHTHIVYLLDIGLFTKVDAEPAKVAERNQHILKALDKKEAELFSG